MSTVVQIHQGAGIVFSIEMETWLLSPAMRRGVPAVASWTGIVNPTVVENILKLFGNEGSGQYLLELSKGAFSPKIHIT